VHTAQSVIVLPTGFFFARHHRRLYGCRLHHAQYFVGDRVIDRHAPEGNASRRARVEPAAMARVRRTSC
jgi:hypothetical protein